jgi:hypothetical protein
MRNSRISHLNRRVWTVVAVTAAFLVPLGVFGGPALARSVAAASEYQYGGSSQYQYKVTICHHTHSKKHPFVQISVSVHAVTAHLRHGDTLGTCPTAPPPAPGGKHGDDGDQGSGGDHHGKSGEHGHGNGNGDNQGQNNDSQSGGHGNGNGKGHGHH